VVVPVYVASSVLLGIIRVAAWAYLLTAALRGLMAGEDPRDGWRLVSLAAGIVLFALVLVNIVGLLEVPEPWIVDLYQWTVVLAYALGHLFLLVAFTIGTPSLDPEPDDDYADYDEDNDDGFETEEAGYEGGPVYDEFP
jgi:hypothetical protein